MIAIINFKAYAQGIGKNAITLAKICASVAAHFPSVRMMLAVQAADIHAVHSSVSLPILAQHVDAIESGAYTGSVLIECVRENGACGSLLHHSEMRMPAREIKICTQKLRTLHMLSIVCARTLAEAKRIDLYGADFIAIEPPALIGTTTSVSTARPQLISGVLKSVKTPILVGAGIHEAKDVHIALELGVAGILVSSDILTSHTPRTELMDLLSGAQKPEKFP